MASLGGLFAAVMDIVSSSPGTMSDIDRLVGSSMTDDIFSGEPLSQQEHGTLP